jgi:hypothetical protein
MSENYNFTLGIPKSDSIIAEVWDQIKFFLE